MQRCMISNRIQTSRSITDVGLSFYLGNLLRDKGTETKKIDICRNVEWRAEYSSRGGIVGCVGHGRG